MLRLAGWLRVLVFGAVLTALLGLVTGAGLLLSVPDPTVVPVWPYLLLAWPVCSVLSAAVFSARLSARVLAGLGPSGPAPGTTDATLAAAAREAGLQPPVCLSTDRELPAPLLLQGLRRCWIVVPAGGAGYLSATEAERCLRQVCNGRARVTLYACTVLFALRFWINLARYCARPWLPRSGLARGTRLTLCFLPLVDLLLAPVLAVGYLSGLLAALLIGPATARSLVAGFGTAGGRPRTELVSAPDSRYADWWAGAAIQRPVEAVSHRPAGSPHRRTGFWRRPVELAAGLAGVASIQLIGVLLFVVLTSHWIALGVAERGLWPGEQALSVPVVDVERLPGQHALIASLGDTGAPIVRLPDGSLAELPQSHSSVAVGDRLSLAVRTDRIAGSNQPAVQPAAGQPALSSLRNRHQDGWPWLVSATVFCGGILALAGWALARRLG